MTHPNEDNTGCGRGDMFQYIVRLLRSEDRLLGESTLPATYNHPNRWLYTLVLLLVAL